MTAENFTDFATTALNGAISSTSSLSFTVTGGQGALFPTKNFVVSIDSELLFIASRSTNTFTVGTRGFNGTTAATHSNAVSVQLAVCSYNFQHLWQNVADTYIPEVPPQQEGNTASTYDNEFEALGSWTLYPASGSGSTIWNINTSVKSHLTLSRVSPDNTSYYAYIAFAPTPSTTWTITCKLSEATSLLVNNSDQAQTSFFVSDLTNPTNGPDSSNRVKVNTVAGNALSSGMLADSSRIVRSIHDTSGMASFIGPSVPISAGAPLWMRINCDGAGGYHTYASLDGITYWNLAFVSLPTFSVQSLGVTFHVYNPSNQFVAQTVALDYVRQTSSFVSSYGS